MARVPPGSCPLSVTHGELAHPFPFPAQIGRPSRKALVFPPTWDLVSETLPLFPFTQGMAADPHFFFRLYVGSCLKGPVFPSTYRAFFPKLFLPMKGRVAQILSLFQPIYVAWLVKLSCFPSPTYLVVSKPVPFPFPYMPINYSMWHALTLSRTHSSTVFRHFEGSNWNSVLERTR